ncbi:unnamed protein product, partial [Symbiodinium sp. CCMP2456]
ALLCGPEHSGIEAEQRERRWEPVLRFGHRLCHHCWRLCLRRRFRCLLQSCCRLWLGLLQHQLRNELGLRVDGHGDCRSRVRSVGVPLCPARGLFLGRAQHIRADFAREVGPPSADDG